MPASNQRLGDLHEAVTEVLIKKMQGTEVPMFNEDGEETGETRIILPSAAEIQAAAKFLADNKVTCAPSEDNKLGELERALEERRNKRRARTADLEQARNDANFMSGLQ